MLAAKVNSPAVASECMCTRPGSSAASAKVSGPRFDRIDVYIEKRRGVCGSRASCVFRAVRRRFARLSWPAASASTPASPFGPNQPAPEGPRPLRRRSSPIRQIPPKPNVCANDLSASARTIAGFSGEQNIARSHPTLNPREKFLRVATRHRLLFMEYVFIQGSQNKY
jgi:hypothetical protein